MSRIVFEYDPAPDIYRVLMPDALGVPRPLRDEHGRAIDFRHEIFASYERANRLRARFEVVDQVFLRMIAGDPAP